MESEVEIIKDERARYVVIIGQRRKLVFRGCHRDLES